MLLKRQESMNVTDEPLAAAASANIFDVSSADFETRVMQASMDTPVIAYFTAPWCGTCKQLSPILEAAVKETGGRVLLAKINLDENQELASMLQVQSVPTVYGFFAGKPVDGFQGSAPSSQIKSLIDKLLEAVKLAGSNALDVSEMLGMAAEALASGDMQNAHGIYTNILQQDPRNAEAYAGMIRTFIAAGQIEEAFVLIENAPEEFQSERCFTQACSALELAQNSPMDGADDAGDLMLRLADDENDHQARLDLALVQFAGGEKEQALENLLEILRRDAAWNEGTARMQLLKCFEALGNADLLTQNARRKMSSILFS